MDAQDRIFYAQTDRGTRIGTARDTVGAVRSGMTLAVWYANQARAIGFKFLPYPLGSIEAEINHGRWLARCPACHGAEEADPGEPIFYCLSCGNADNGGQVMEAIFPDNMDLIEQALLIRPDMGSRNWSPGEKFDDLLRENAEHGLDDA